MAINAKYQLDHATEQLKWFKEALIRYKKNSKTKSGVLNELDNEQVKFCERQILEWERQVIYWTAAVGSTEEFEDSVEATDFMYSLQTSINSAKLMDWAEATDTNWCGNTVELLKTVIAAYDDFINEMEKGA